MNKWLGVGRIVKDAELIKKDTFQAVRFTIAVDRDYKKANGEKITDFILIEQTGKNLEKFSYFLKKGTLISVDGTLNIDNYKSGEEYKTFTKIKANRIELLSSKKDNDNDKEIGQGTFECVDDSNIPF